MTPKLDIRLMDWLGDELGVLSWEPETGAVAGFGAPQIEAELARAEQTGRVCGYFGVIRDVKDPRTSLDGFRQVLAGAFEGPSGVFLTLPPELEDIPARWPPAPARPAPDGLTF